MKASTTLLGVSLLLVAVGNDEAVEALIGPETEVIELGGRTVIPGLIDNHMHFTRGVERWHLQARIDGVNSRAAALDIIRGKAESLEPGAWMMVQGGWSEGQFADQPGGFTLDELDTAAPENPLFVQQSYFTIYANSLALEAVGLSPADGARRSAMGLASSEPPYGELIQQIPPVTAAQREQNLTDFMAVLNRAGLTGVYALGRPPEGDIATVARRAGQGPLPLRIWHTLRFQAYDSAEADSAVELFAQNAPNSFDGMFGLFGLGEHVYIPFFDNPGISEPWDPAIIAEFMKLATAAARGGWHIHEHTMNDISVQDLLDEFEVLNETVPLAPLRWSLAHVFTLSADSIARAKALGLTIAIHSVSMHEPSMAVDDSGEARPVGPPLRDIQDSGLIWGLGTDATIVAHYQPFISLGWAVSGLNLAGDPVLDQTVTREEALIAHTRSNAYLFFQEGNLGTLEAGKLADLVVLDRDYLTVPADEIKDIQPVLTMIGGRVVFESLR